LQYLENSLWNKQLQMYHNTDYGMNTGSITAACCNDKRFSDLRCVQELNSDQMSQSTKMECNLSNNGPHRNKSTESKWHLT
jgi:hypothetical protein